MRLRPRRRSCRNALRLLGDVSGNGVAGDTITVNGTGGTTTAIVGSGGMWTVTISLAHGTYKLTATQTDPVSGLVSAASSSVTVSISH